MDSFLRTGNRLSFSSLLILADDETYRLNATLNDSGFAEINFLSGMSALRLDRSDISN